MTHDSNNPTAALAELSERIVQSLRKIHDPEIPVNIYDLGLIYGIDIDENAAVRVRMTLTSPNCPVAGSLVGMVESSVRATPGVASAKVELVWEPPWTPEKMSDTGKMLLELERGVSIPGPKMYNISTPG